MANSIALIQKYMQNAIDTVFAQESVTRVLENGTKWMDLNFKEAGHIKIASLLLDGLSDYYRVNHDPMADSGDYTHYNDETSRDGYRKGNASLTWEIMKLRFDRGIQFQIDDMDDEESAGLMIGNTLTEFLRTKVVPEVDAVRLSTLASKCNVALGNLKSETIAENTIIKNLNGAFEWLFDHEVPEEEQVIFVSPSVLTLMRNTNEVVKYLGQADFKNGDVNFTVQTYMGRPIIPVPTNRFFTDIVVSQNGYFPAPTGKVINYMVVSKKAVVPVVKLNKNKIWTPDQVQDFDGYKINFRMYHDVVVPKNKLAGVYCSVSETVATTKTNLLSVVASKDGDGPKYVVSEYYTQPAGVRGTLVQKTTEMKVGTAYKSDLTSGKVEIGVPFTKVGTTAYFAILDDKGKALAVSKQVSLPD